MKHLWVDKVVFGAGILQSDEARRAGIVSGERGIGHCLKVKYIQLHSLYKPDLFTTRQDHCQLITLGWWLGKVLALVEQIRHKFDVDIVDLGLVEEQAQIERVGVVEEGVVEVDAPVLWPCQA